MIIATNDVRALARYYAADTVARFSMASLAATPKPASGARDLEVTRATPDDAGVMAEIEMTVVGFARHDDYRWLFEHREGYQYRRGGKVIGFGFFSETGVGPIAALELHDQSEILLHLEGRAHECGVEEVEFSGADRQCRRDAPLARSRLQVRCASEHVHVEPSVWPVRQVHRVRPLDRAVTGMRSAAFTGTSLASQS